MVKVIIFNKQKKHFFKQKDKNPLKQGNLIKFNWIKIM